jgi:hypothetical protein
MNDFVVFPSRRKLLLYAVGALIFIAGGIFILRTPSIPWFDKVIGGYGGVAFFGLCLVYLLYRVIKPSPSLIINHEGIFDNASALGVGLLRWSEIADVQIYQFLNQRFLGIVPTNVDRVLERQSAMKRWLLKMNQRYFVSAPFNIPENVLPIRLEDVLAQIQRRRLT